MSYHTHFYACDPDRQVAWAKDILGEYKERLQKKLDNIPSDNFFKKIYEGTKEMVTDEEYAEFHEKVEKYNWPKDIVEKNEAFYAKYRRDDYTWESEKNEWIDNLNNMKNTGLLDLKFDGDFALDYVAFLIDNWARFKELNTYVLDYQAREGKIYSGHILPHRYSVNGRYCQSMWFNPDGIIAMIEDRVDVNNRNEDGHYPMVKLSDAEKKEINDLFHDYPDSYCWVI